MGKDSRVLPLCRRIDLMLSLDVSMKSRQFYHIVFPVAQKVQWCHYKSISHPSWWIMQADPLCVFCTVLSSLPSQEVYVLETSMLETHFFLRLNRHPCASHLEPPEKMVLVYSCFLDHWAPHIHHWNVCQHCWNSPFLDLEVWEQVDFLSAVLNALLTANLGKQCVSFSLL